MLLSITFVFTLLYCLELAGKLNSLAVSHLEEVSDEGIQGLAKRPSVAVILPTTAYILRLKPPPARKLIESGVPVALGSDFNPNAHCMSMSMVMHLACVNMRLTMPEALVAATLNAAASMGKSDSHGSLEKGKFADLVLVEVLCLSVFSFFCNAECPQKADAWEHVIYELGDPPIKAVVKKGKVCAGNV